MKIENIMEQLQEQAPTLVKDNKGALIGAVVGYLLTDNKQVQSTLLGLLAGSVLVDGTKSREEDE